MMGRHPGHVGVSAGLRKLRSRATIGCCLAVIAAFAAAGCASSSSPAQSAMSAANQAAMRNPNLDLGTSLYGERAPDIKLVNQFDQPMSLSQFRGRVVILAFSDSECTTVCPLTTQSMVLAKELLGKAGDSVQLLGVDANPDATKVSDVMGYSRAHDMVNQWDFLTGSPAQLRAVWKAYNIEVQIEAGDIDHTPALYVINQQGTLEKLYLTTMAYSSVTQSAQVLASEVATLLPSHPKLSSIESLATIAAQTPASAVTLPAAEAAGEQGREPHTVTLGPGKPRLVVFFATWLTETSDLSAELTGLNSYAKAAAARHLPALTAVDETVTEPSEAAVSSYLATLGPLDYQVALDKTGRVADGYGVQDQPWLVLVNAAGKITWSHDGWVPVAAIEKAAAAHP
ncbi:MAG TPA: SCO family protein [Trebonia sp.]|jgi:cytochrome oxidase Cu insertion factor (SCO1/SenC/PrrC family)|nr:SCO family protein [Trebonia sp.]